METEKTYRRVAKPQISSRFLADYMAASEKKRRTIIRNCKFQSIARVIQHEKAKNIITNYMTSSIKGEEYLKKRLQELRVSIADSDYEQDLFDHNADYVERFIKILPSINMPSAEITNIDGRKSVQLNGVLVTTDFRFGLVRTTKTNKIKYGAASLRYAKGKKLDENVGLWQSALTFGLIGKMGLDEGREAEKNLCITIDAYSGAVYEAPTNSVSRFNNMEAACATIAEQWDNVQPPPGAIY